MYSGPLYSGHLGTRRTVLIIEVSLFQGLKMYYQTIWFHVSTLEGCLQFKGWIRGGGGGALLHMPNTTHLDTRQCTIH